MAAGADGFCFQHSPARAAERDSARRRGGLARSKALARATLANLEGLPPELKNPDAVRRLLESIIGHTLTGKLDCRIAAVVATLCGCVLKSLDVENLSRDLESAASMDIESIRAALKASRNPCPDDTRGPHESRHD